MEYKIVSCEWTSVPFERGPGTTHEDLVQHKRDTFELNMRQFTALMNAAMEDDWMPHGSPTFSQNWTFSGETKVGSGGNYGGGQAIQAMVRDIPKKSRR